MAREGNASEGAFGATTCTKDSFREVEVQFQYCGGGKTVDSEWIADESAKNLPCRSSEMASSQAGVFEASRSIHPRDISGDRLSVNAEAI
jgi:hypothetical protein